MIQRILHARHFLACIRGEAVSLSDGTAGLRVVKVLEAAMRSLRAGGARVPYAMDAREAETVFKRLSLERVSSA